MMLLAVEKPKTLKLSVPLRFCLRWVQLVGLNPTHDEPGDACEHVMLNLTVGLLESRGKILKSKGVDWSRMSR